DNNGGDGGTKPGDNNGGNGGTKPGDNNGGDSGTKPDKDKSKRVEIVNPKMKNGKATIDKKDFEAVIDKISGNNGELSIDLGKEHNIELKLTKEQVELLKANDIPLTVQNDEVTLKIPTSIFTKGTVDVVLKPVANISNAKGSVYDFTIIIDGKVIHQFADPVTLVFDVNMNKIKNTNNLKVFYFNEQTMKWELVPGAIYKNGKVTVNTNHFSTFTVFEVEGDQTSLEVKAPISQNGNGLPNTATNSFNLLAAGLLLLLLGSILFFIKWRKQA
ncbi:prepro-alkaline protease, partial [Neobacillus bataviensis LMG 21833]